MIAVAFHVFSTRKMTQKQISKLTGEAVHTMNTWGAARKPFLFVIDYAMQKPLYFPLENINADEIMFNVHGLTNSDIRTAHSNVKFEKCPIAFEDYQVAFDQVMTELRYGNSFLLNLTCSTPIECNLSLLEIFGQSRAKYKLYLRDQVVVFSPETFVRIKKGRIASFPMKGTIDASLPDAENQILNNAKETAEHITIVDLIRNDLSRVASDVRVDRFRYVEEIRTHQKTLLQVSSEISGQLPVNYHKQLGDIMYSLLPAGSISGAPKIKTVEILRNAEIHERGYFTGVCGYFDGMDLESGVMIRYIEKQDGKMIYKSGGGITTQSIAAEEYQEMIDKVYVPIIKL